MEPVLRPGDWVLVWRGFRSRRRRPGDQPPTTARDVRVRPGQLVIARHPLQPDLLLVKRAAWREAGGWWVTADNPAVGGEDSFRFGPVPPDLIEGRVLGRYRPRSRSQITS